jgi:hypothetical protein
VTLSHRDQLGGVQATSLGLTDQRGGGVLVAVAGGGGDRQPQPGACRSDRRRLGRFAGPRPSRIVAGTGGVAGRGWRIVRVAVLAVVVGGRLDR